MLNPQTLDPLSLPFVQVADRERLPKKPGIYFVYTFYKELQYIGRAKSLRDRWFNHHRLHQLRSCYVFYMDCATELLDEAERSLIEHFNPPLNGTMFNLKSKPLSDYNATNQPFGNIRDMVRARAAKGRSKEE